MPIPKPRSNEEQSEFISRCMANDTMVEEYPQGDQRLAVCAVAWQDNQKEVKMNRLEKSINTKLTKKMDISTKVLDEAKRIIRFTASTESYDRDDDRLFLSGWKFDEYDKNPIFLYMHDYEIPAIGKCVNHFIDTVGKALVMDIQFPTIEELSTDSKNVHEHALFADMMYNMYKNKYMNAVSVGFMGYEGVYNEKQGIDFTSQGLLELSGVTVPANADAVSRGAKALGKTEEEVKTLILKFNGEEVDESKPDTKIIDAPVVNKVLDIDGLMSCRDIERLIDRSLPDDKWSLDIYPVNYPSGHCSVVNYDDDSYKFTMHEYVIEKIEGELQVMISLGTPIEYTEQYVQKAIEKNALSKDFTVKAGAVLSAKNKGIIESVIANLVSGSASLKELLDGAEEEKSLDNTIDDDSGELRFLLTGSLE